jgi:transposase-like protein
MESERIKGITCNNPIEAEGFRSALQEAGIESNIFDETNSKVARGILDNTIEVLVKTEDYEQAIKVYRSFITAQQSLTPWCPKCGSENVTIQKKKSATVRQLPRILATLLTFIPIGVCTTDKYICKDCGHKWER